MKLCVVGLGYTGLPTAAMFANAGLEVLGVDKKPQVVEALTKGEIIIEEDGLAEYVKNVVASGRLRASMDIEPADAFIISVPTPITEDKKSDMRFVVSATESVASVLKKGDLVILESTSPVGTVEELMIPILEKASGLRVGRDFSLGHSPERVIPGHILYELENNNRVAGGIDELSANRIAELYHTFVKGEITTTDARTAEMCKLSENTYRDVNIAFANELARICASLGINVWELIRVANKHPRVNILSPGPGVGGHCIAVDPWFIVEKEPSLANIIRDSRITNDSMPSYVADKIDSILFGEGKREELKVCILGATYKPDVDDMRESPIVVLAGILRERGYNVVIQDSHAFRKFAGVEEDVYEAARDADIVVLGVNHSVYRDIDFEKLAGLVRRKNFLDTRNCIHPKEFKYYLLGRD